MEDRGASEPVEASMKLLGAHRSPRATGLEPLRRRTHYFLGNDPAAWRTNVPHFRRVRYDEVYPGIDLDYYYRDGELEYDFIVAPGADPATIRLTFEGFDQISIDRKGDLVLRNAAGELRQHRPFVYQEFGGTKQEVPGRYRLSSGNSVSFVLAKYDPALPLVIDPRISMSTYIGGSSQDFAVAAAVGPDSCVWVAGATQSTDFPVPAQQARPSLPGLRATFLNRYDQQIDPDGRSSRVLSETIFLGGTAGTLPDSIPVALEVDTDGNLYILGETTTTDFPLSDNPHQGRFRGERDMYVTVIAPGGSGGPVALGAEMEQSQPPALLYSTYIGGPSLEVPTSADLGNCPSPLAGPCFFFAGQTESASVETTPNAPSAARGFEDPLVGILAADPIAAQGFALGYLARLGGSGRDTNPQVLALEDGGFCLSMTTTSDDLPVPPEVLAGAMHPSRLAGEDGFLMCTAPASSASLTFKGPEQNNPFDPLPVERATYVRGPGRDAQDRMELLNMANAFGFSPAPDLPLKDLREVVMAVIDSNSPQLAVDPVVNLGDPFQSTNPGDQSGYLVVMNRDLTVLLAGGWLGGSGEEEFAGVADMDGYLLIGSNTTSLDFPGAVNSFSGGRWDAATIFIENFKVVLADSLTEAVGEDNILPLLAGDLGEEFPRNNPGRPYRYSTNYFGGPGRDEVNQAFFGTDRTIGFVGLTDSIRPAFQQQTESRLTKAQASPGFPITQGAPQERYGGGSFDGFLMEFLQPVLERRAFLGAASFLERDVAPGQIITIFAASVGPPIAILIEFDEQGKALTQLGLTRVLFDGEPAPMVFTSRNQVSAVAPFNLEGKETTEVQVEFDGVASNRITVPVAPTAPGIFSANQTGRGQGAILNQDSSFNKASNPEAPGRAIQIFLTGAGQTDPPGVDGERAPPATPFPRITAPVSVKIGGLDARVFYKGAAPNLIHGVAQINAFIPEDVTAGDAVPIEIMIGDAVSRPGVTVAVGASE